MAGSTHITLLVSQIITIQPACIFRIVAVADAFATMTVDRVYAAARSHEAAAVELRRSAGSHFDPIVVEALLSALGYAGRQAREAA